MEMKTLEKENEKGNNRAQCTDYLVDEEMLERTINYCQDCKNWLCEVCGAYWGTLVKGNDRTGGMYKNSDGISNNSCTYRLGVDFMNLDGE